TDERASQYASYGFEVADHPSRAGGCIVPTEGDAQLNVYFSDDLAAWRAKYVSLPAQQTSRHHCYTWNSWDVMPLADIANGIRYDLNTVAFPVAWIGSKSPLVTGSGMNMRLTDASGAMVDVRQGVTNFDNISADATSIAAAFDNALGSNGYYGIFGSHYDMTDDYEDTLYSLAKSRNVPIISSQQALTWLDGRNSSNFLNLTSSERGKVSFTIVSGEGAHGLQAMMPMKDAGGSLTSLAYEGQAVDYRTDIIKGVQYAIFSALPGDYDVTYSDVAVAPTVSGNTPAAGGQAQQQGGSPAIDEPAAEEDISGIPPHGETGPIEAPMVPISQPVEDDEPTASITPWVVAAGSVVVVAAGGSTIVWRIRRS
ncbi:MAG TPA: hypothetical protein VFS65_02485, partial [Candidatus Saccharimonadales bacterium]|nr:hypothetical protein [Candidatus Saccharimonadales bacterium]